jgi:phosphate:Na+ symporter
MRILDLKGSRVGLAVALCLAIFLLAGPALAATGEGAPNWGKMAMGLFGGLALFLFGMEQMADALKAVAGERMKSILARLTTNRFMGATTGAFVTAIIQSSSVTTVLVVGFVTAGLMSMSQSIGVIMGANIGTTITAQIVAFKVTKYALLMIAVGFGFLFISNNKKVKQYGGMLMGLGLVFFGMSVMSDAMKPLRSFQPFLDLMTQMENPLVGILIAAAFTGLVQSSSATTAIVIVMAPQGFITLPAGIALAFGANIGTCVTAMLAAIGKPREAVRAALVHVLFNIFGVLLWIAFIDQLAAVVTWLSPVSQGLSELEARAADSPRQIANAHTIFNVANTLIFIGFTTQFARLVEKLVPDRPLTEAQLLEPRYLAPELISTPSIAIGRIRMELGRMGERIETMLDTGFHALLTRDEQKMEQAVQLDEEVEHMNRLIIDYAGQVAQESLSPEDTQALLSVMSAANDFENIGDIVETDFADQIKTCVAKKFHISESTREVLAQIHQEVFRAVQLANEAMSSDDQEKAQAVLSIKADFQVIVEAAEAHEAKRLTAPEPHRFEAYSVEVEAIEKLKRIYYFAKRIAKTVVREEPPAAEESPAPA